MLRTLSHPLSAYASRTCHVIDIENQLGGADTDAETVRRWWRIYREQAVGIRPGDQVLMGASHHAAIIVWFALAGENIVHRVRSGKNGAELALLDSIEIERIATRFDRLVIASGDGEFTDLAQAARDLGMRVHQVVGLGASSRALSAACGTHGRIRLLARTAVDLAA